jgi:RimJ/RimL family protein N-acetyltransferase
MPDEAFTELAGPRVALRRFQLGDVADFVAYRSAEEVARFQSWDAHYPREAGERFVRQMMNQHPDTPGEWFQLAVGEWTDDLEYGLLRDEWHPGSAGPARIE